MKAGQCGSSWKDKTSARKPNLVRSRWPVCALGVLVLLAAGCATDRGGLDKRLLAAKPPDPGNAPAADSYVVAFPDVVEVHVMGRPDVSGQFAVGLDGRIELGGNHRDLAQILAAERRSRVVAWQGTQGTPPGGARRAASRACNTWMSRRRAICRP